MPPQPIKTMMSVHGDVVGDKVGDVVGGSGWLGVGQKIPNYTIGERPFLRLVTLWPKYCPEMHQK